uniref:ABC transporter permease n=1 Tax=Streptomyces polyasparticus TaxID=2767826 RepID=UPI001F41A321|nr:ABC transporter permease [Streptomyces polyasparticus]
MAAARADLLDTVGAQLAKGGWLNRATAAYPVTVLGAKAAELLGITEAGPDIRVWLGGRWFTVAGILEPASLAPELDTTALVGWDMAKESLTSTATPPRSTPAPLRPRPTPYGDC